MCWTGPHLDKSCLSPHHCWLGHPILLSSYFKPKLKASQNTKEEGNHVFMMVSQHDKVTVFLQLPATGEKERGYLCALDLHAQLGPCSPFGLSLASVPMMPRAYRKPSFLFQRWSYFCARWNNCCVYHGRDLEGKGIATHSWARLSGGESFITSINCNRDRWVLVWHQKRQNDIFSSSASVSWGSANASLWLSVMCLQISSDGGCDELPGGWCSPGVVGTVTSSRNREGLDSHNIYHEPVPRHSGYRGNRSYGPCYAVPAPLSDQCFSHPKHCSSHSKCALGRWLRVMDWHSSPSRTGPAKALMPTKERGLGRVPHSLAGHRGGLYLDESCPLRAALSSQFLLSSRNQAGATWSHSLQGRSGWDQKASNS